MNTVTLYNKTTAERQPDLQRFRPGLFADFVSWTDRSEKTTRSYLTNLRQFAAWLAYQKIQAPQRQDIILYRQYLLSEHDAIQYDPEAGWRYRTNGAGELIRTSCAPNTAAQYLRSVSQFFRWTAAAGIYPDIAANIHAPKIRHNIHRKDALAPAEVLQIERSISAYGAHREAEAAQAGKDPAGRLKRATEQNKRLLAMYLLAVNCGLRTIEISRANIRDIEEKGGQAWIYIQGKGHAEPDQKKPLAKEVLAAIREYLSCRPGASAAEPLFTSTGNRSGGKRLAPSTISTQLKNALRQAGFNSNRITAHSLRHTAGTSVQELTGNIYLTQVYMRHSNPATTEIYLHNNTDQAEAAIAQRLYEYYHAGEKDDAAEK